MTLVIDFGLNILMLAIEERFMSSVESLHALGKFSSELTVFLKFLIGGTNDGY